MNRIFVLIFSALLSLGVSINANGKERVVPYNYELSVVQEGNSLLQDIRFSRFGVLERRAISQKRSVCVMPFTEFSSAA